MRWIAVLVGVLLLGACGAQQPSAEPQEDAAPAPVVVDSPEPAPDAEWQEYKRERAAREAREQQRLEDAEQRLLDGAPPFEVEGPPSSSGEIRVIVDRTITEGEAYVIAELIRGDLSEPGGYFVSINCRTGGTDTFDNRQGNATIAVGELGMAQTGFVREGATVELVEGRTCP